MNISEYDKLPLREKDALVAENVIGFTVYRYETEDGAEYSVLGMQPAIPGITHEKPVRVNLKEYTKDLNACREMETAMITQKRVFDTYSWLLEKELHYEVYASAEQKCKAALQAVGFLKQ